MRKDKDPLLSAEDIKRMNDADVMQTVLRPATPASSQQSPSAPVSSE